MSAYLLLHDYFFYMFADVIGRLISIDSPQNREIGGRVTKLVDFVIEDLE